MKIAYRLLSKQGFDTLSICDLPWPVAIHKRPFFPAVRSAMAISTGSGSTGTHSLLPHLTIE
jgi:hypothetical protein